MNIDDEALAVLRQQIEAQLALAAEEKRKNDLLEAALKQSQVDAQIRQVTERNRVGIAVDTNEKVAGIAAALPEVFLSIHGSREWQKEASRRLDRIDEIALIQLSGRASDHRERVTELKKELDREHNERLLSQEYENLQELEGQAAQHGAIDIPLRLLNQIKKTRQRISELEAQLG